MKRLCLWALAVLILVLLTGCGYKSAAVVAPGSPGSDKGIATLEDLKGKNVGVSVGSGSDILLTGDKNYVLSRYDTAADALMGLKNDSISALAVEITTAREILKKNDGLSVISGNVGYENYGVAFPKGNDELKYKMDLFIDYLNQSGAYDNLVNRWIRTGADVIAMPEFAIKPGDVLRVAIDATYTPFEYFGENNELLGFDIEFIYRFAQFYNLRIEFFNSSFASLFTALDSNQVDLVISAVAITSDRQERYTFSQSYYANEIVFVVKTPLKSGGISQMSQLSGKSIAVMSGSVQDVVLKEHVPGALLFYYNDDQTELKSLRAKRIDALAASDFGAEMLAQYNQDLIALPEKTEYGQVALVVDNENPGLSSKINGAIQQLKAGGALEKLHSKWFSLGSAPKELTEVNLNGANGTVRFGVAPQNNPYVYIENTRIVGYDIDLIDSIALELGMQVEVVELEASKSSLALQSGKVDVIGGGLLVSQESSPGITFTTPYDTAYLSLVVLQNSASQSGGFWKGLYGSFYNNIIKEQRYTLIWQGLWETVIISFFSILLGTLLGALVCSMKRSKGRVLRSIANYYVKIMQGIPIVVLLLIVCYVIFANVSFSQTGVAIIAFSAYFAAYVCEILNSGLNSVDKGQREAATALGYTRTGAFLKHILPQAITQALPIYRGECISLIKNTSIVGFIAIQDLTKASDIIRSRTYEAFFPLIMVAIIYFAIAWAMTYGLKLLEKRLDIRERKRSVAL